EIDTLNEKYQAQVYIEARWSSDIGKLTLTADQYRQLNEGNSVTVLKYGEANWTPELFVENAVGELKEVIRYTLKKNNNQRDYQNVEICERRDVKGTFWEKLELHHFPSDVQELTVSVASSYYDDKVLLQKDEHHLSCINREAFVDQQEWLLYEHVGAQTRFTVEYPFRDENDNKEEKRRSIFSATCHAG
ncbi:unnamed protein product, partial [Didymodactylos carnosus]